MRSKIIKSLYYFFLTAVVLSAILFALDRVEKSVIVTQVAFLGSIALLLLYIVDLPKK